MTDIRDLSDVAWGPVSTHAQSRYVAGVCERCDDPIRPGERHEYRAWRSGPAEVCQHFDCPELVHEAHMRGERQDSVADCSACERAYEAQYR